MENNEEPAGIYIHIPFCKQACNYCNFHFSTSLDLKEDLLKCLEKEIILRKNYLEGRQIQTIYFGGGTPSLLSTDEIKKLLQAIYSNFEVIENAEFTLEANPDDLTKEKLSELKNAGINRLSIGVQSFFDKELKWMNRSHDAIQAENCIRNAKEIGFDNITIDLIYGVPGLTNTEWKQNLEKAIELNIDHLSCYALTVEPKTALYHQIEKDKLPPLNEQQAAEQFEILMAFAKQTGFEHYEISNFARDKKYSKHNTSYWKGNWYLGIGPSAHSFNSSTRQWNIANNALYIKNINEDKDPSETEILTIPQQYNEFVMISLRTMWGMDLHEIKNRFGETYLHLIQKESARYIQSGDIVLENEKMKLSDKGKLIADKIISDLFFI